MIDPDDNLTKVPRRFVVSIWREPSNPHGIVRGRIYPADAEDGNGAPGTGAGFLGLDGIAAALRRLLSAKH